MIRTIAGVAAGEGLGSVVSRAVERVSEGAEHQMRIFRGLFSSRPQPSVVNVITSPPSPRTGGVETQLRLRLGEERHLREVALHYPHTLEVGSRAWSAAPVAMLDARAIILEGAFHAIPLLPDAAELILVIHDFSMLSANAHQLDVDDRKLAAARALFVRARAAVFPSAWLRDAYLPFLPTCDTYVIEPGIAGVQLNLRPSRDRIAVAGSVKPHKGGALIPSLVRAMPEVEWHVFGGGDVELLRAIRALRGVTVHGYYRSGTLPRLLARHSIGLAVLPSIVGESFSLTLSECWSANVPVVAFEHGAIAERIRTNGGGFLVPQDSGVEGIVSRIREWRSGASPSVPAHVPTAREAAAAHVSLYRSKGLC